MGRRPSPLQKKKLTIRSGSIHRTSRIRTRTSFLRVTFARTRPTDLIGRSELTVLATILVGIVAEGIFLEPASLGVTAFVVAATGLTSAIAILARLDDAVTTLITGDDRHSLVGRETVRFNAIPSHGRADVTDRTWTELRDPLPCRWIHDVSLSGIACPSAERTALLRVDRRTILTRLTGAIVYGPKDMTGLMAGDDAHNLSIEPRSSTKPERMALLTQ